MNEIWKDINEYEGLYQISSLGNVKSLERISGAGKTVHERIRILSFGGSGYLQVGLSKNNKVKQHQVHRLVANAFIENPENKEQVDHIDNIKTNNCVNNLRWVTPKENMNNDITKNTLLNRPERTFSEEWKQKISDSMKGRVSSKESRKKLSMAKMGHGVSKELRIKISDVHSKAIICLNDMNLFKSDRDAARYYNVSTSSISKICRGETSEVKGLSFMFKNEYDNLDTVRSNRGSRR